MPTSNEATTMIVCHSREVVGTIRPGTEPTIRTLCNRSSLIASILSIFVLLAACSPHRQDNSDQGYGASVQSAAVISSVEPDKAVAFGATRFATRVGYITANKLDGPHISALLSDVKFGGDIYRKDGTYKSFIDRTTGTFKVYNDYYCLNYDSKSPLCFDLYRDSEGNLFRSVKDKLPARNSSPIPLENLSK